MADSFTYDVFLSHNSRDKPQVRKLAKRLKKAGLRVWFDDWVIKPGDDIYLAIERGLEAARVQVLCLSPAALGSEWVTLERSTVLFRDPTNTGRRFVPLLLADSTLPDTLRRYKYVDFRQETPAAFDELLAACRGESEAAPPAAQREPKKKPTKRKPKPEKPPEQAEPLAVLERKLTGHKGWVRSVAVSPDGKWAASGSDDKTVKIWDLETGECRATLKGHTSPVRFVACQTDYALSSANDGTIRIWDVRARKLLSSLQTDVGEVHFAHELFDRTKFLLSGSSVNIKLLDRGTGETVREFQGHTGPVVSAALAETLNRLVSGSFDESVRLWNLETGECLATLEGHSGYVLSVQITPDGRFAVSGSDDKTVKVWDLEGGTCVGTLEGHNQSVMSVAISPDGTLIASTGFIDHTVRLWDWKSGTCLHVIKNDENSSTISVAFSPDGSRLVVGTVESTIYVYRLTGVRVAPSAEPTRRYVNAKVVLLGEGAVGKTSLAYRLIEDKYVVKDRTHDMNVWSLVLPLPPDATLEREALLWDLAGQEDYRLIHRLFLDETSLALLLINPQKDDPFAEAGDWLKALDTAAINNEEKRVVARLLIFSQIDVGGMKIGNAKIERFIQEHRFADWLATSAKTGENCSDGANAGKPSKLKQLIADRIPWEALPWTAVHRSNP